MKRLGVIGIGNTLRRDDGIGIALLERLRERRKKLPAGIDYIDGGTGGMSLLHVLARFDVVLIIDAVQFDGYVGEAKVFRSDAIISRHPPVTLATHESDIVRIIKLSEELREKPKQLFIFGVQPKDTSPGTRLSEELHQNIQPLVDRLQKEITAIFTKEKV
jgi:hydrogenase maturation protease